MNRLICFLSLFLTIFINGLCAQPFDLYIKGSVTYPPSLDRQINGQMDIFLDGGVKLLKSDSIFKSEKGNLAVLKVHKVYRFAKIELRYPGYKKITKNCYVEKTGKSLLIEIGNVFLKKSKETSISDVIYSLSPDGFHRFRIIIYNPHSKTNLFSLMKINGKIQRDKVINCNKPVGVSLSLADEIKFYPKNDSISSMITAHGDGFSFPTSGKFTENLCSGISEISLESPIDFYITNGYSVVDLFFPDYFKIIKTQNLEGVTVSNDMLEKNKVSFEQFEYLNFELFSNDPDLEKLQFSVKL